MRLSRIDRFSIGSAALACLFCGIALLACAGLTSCGGGAQASGSSASLSSVGYRHVSVEEAAELMKDPNVIVADVRGEVDYDMGHIPGAICVGYDKIEAGEAASLLPDKDQTIVVYCDYGGVSKKAAEKLVAEGYTGIVEFDGLEVWKGELACTEDGCC